MRGTRIAALPGAALFLLSCALVRGGLFDDRHFGDTSLYGGYAHQMTSGHWPYRDFFDEYPPLAQPLFVVVRLLPGSFTATFRWTMAILGVAALVLLVEALGTVRAPLHRVGAAVLVVGLSPLLLGPVFLNEYDLFPALLTAGALLAFLQSRERTTYVLLALAVAAKWYPLVLLPLALVEMWDRGGRAAVRRAAGWFLGVLVVVHLPFAVTGLGGLRFSYWVQIRRGLEVESLGGAILLVLHRIGVLSLTLRDVAPGSRDAVGGVPRAVAALSSLVVVVVVLWIAWLYARGRRDTLLAAAAAVTAFVTLGKVLSPQFLVWLVPLVPAAGIGASAILGGALGLTHLEWDRFVAAHGTVDHWGRVLSWWILARDLALLGLLAYLVVRLRAAATRRSRR
jgi:Glycosyltransferase family 87